MSASHNTSDTSYLEKTKQDSIMTIRLYIKYYSIITKQINMKVNLNDSTLSQKFVAMGLLH